MDTSSRGVVQQQSQQNQIPLKLRLTGKPYDPQNSASFNDSSVEIENVNSL